MGKKTKKKGNPAKESPSTEPFHTPFSGLASLRAGLPSLEAPDSAAEPKSEPPPSTLTGSTKLVLQREKNGRAGKTVTRLRGLPTPEGRQGWAKRLKQELGCGASLEGEDVILLGDVGERAKARLEAGGFRRVVLGG